MKEIAKFQKLGVEFTVILEGTRLYMTSGDEKTVIRNTNEHYKHGWYYEVDSSSKTAQDSSKQAELIS